MMEMAVDKEEVEERRGEKFEKINKNWGDKERSMLRQMAKRKMSPSQTMIAFFFLSQSSALTACDPFAVHTR